MKNENRMHASANSLQNHFLIAMPSIRDSLFSQSVTYVCDHGPEGAMGVIINHPLDLTLADVFAQLELSTSHPLGAKAVLAGGPVQTQRGFVLHSTGGQWQSTLQVSADVCLTASRDIIYALANNQGPSDAQLVLGYAGWEAGQLEEEIVSNSWLTIPADSDILFNTPVEQRWSAVFKRLGIDPNLMPTTAGHA